MKTITKRTLTSAVTTVAISSAAIAGNLETTPVEPQVYTPVAVAPVVGEWTGFYGGLQLGYADIGGDAGLDGNDTSYGVHLGYDYDFGSYVLGAELDYDKTDIDLNGGAANVDSMARLKFKGGYDLGSTLIYATAGAARADTSFGNESGAFAGLGVAYKVTDQYTVGAELLEHRFKDVGGTAGADMDATTFNIRGSYRF